MAAGGDGRADRGHTDRRLAVAILIGYAILVATRLFKLNPLLSDFGPRKSPVLPLWWNMALVANFSVAISLTRAG